jgi:hypothetical protein
MFAAACCCWVAHLAALQQVPHSIHGHALTNLMQQQQQQQQASRPTQGVQHKAYTMDDVKEHQAMQACPHADSQPQLAITFKNISSRLLQGL